MNLIVQPRDGIAPIVSAIKQATKTLEMVIFRFDRPEIEQALGAAVGRGVAVRCLIAHTNNGGEKPLRKLEQRMLDAGITIARTGDDFVRYHGKLLIVDRAIVHVNGFNFTALDIDKSRSFGVITKNRELVQEASRLFEADATRQPYSSSLDTFVISPENARPRLSDFIRQAKKQLLIYDPKVTDPAMLRLLQDRAKAGVEVRILGRAGTQSGGLVVQKFPGTRFHVRAIVRDGEWAFVGSQSLRKVELDNRREVGIIFGEPKLVKEIVTIFEDDWSQTEAGKKQLKKAKEAVRREEKGADEIKEQRQSA